MEKRGQVWISVVIYTLVGLTTIGLLLVAFQPKIKESRDSITIKQTIEAFHNIDSSIKSTLVAPGNKRQIELKLTSGEMTINPNTDTINWIMKSEKQYSETNIAINEGSIEILTQEGNPWVVMLTLNYSEVADLTYSNQDEIKVLPKAGNVYPLSIENLGKETGQRYNNVNIALRS